jgi:di/tricarboxylate transporter
MTWEIGAVLAVLVVTVILFATEKLAIDLIAIALMAGLVASGLLTPEQGLAGLGNSATVTVAAMFVLSEALRRTGALDVVGDQLVRIADRSFWLAAAAMMVLVGVISAFINNTAAVAVFLPIVLAFSRDAGVSPSKLLIPLSFAGIFGGTCTLIGTSTNVLLDSIATRSGQEAIGMFELAPLGLVLFAAGVVYLLLAGMRILPSRGSEGDLTESYGMHDYLFELRVSDESGAVGKRLPETDLVRDLDLDVLFVSRDGEKRPANEGSTARAGDTLVVRGGTAVITRLREWPGVEVRPQSAWRDEDVGTEDTILVEVVVGPNSPLVGRKLRRARLPAQFPAAVLAIRHGGRVVHEELSDYELRSGDVLLVETEAGSAAALRSGRAFVFVSELDPDAPRRPGKLGPSLAVLATVVTLAATGVLPVVAAAVCGCVAVVLLRCLTLEEAYQAIDWRIVLLLAGVLSLGAAMETTGTALWLSERVVGLFGRFGNEALVSAFFLLTALLTAAMSNNATAALLAPIALATAESLGVSPRPFLMAIVYGASACFMTPVGYQTNTLVYGPGEYRFADFLRVGTPLVLLFWGVASLLIPRIWPL